LRNVAFFHPKFPPEPKKRWSLSARGQSMIEFAFMLPIIVILLMGTVDLGHGIYAYGVVSSAAREGARYGTTNHDDATDTGCCGTISVVARANTQALDSTKITVASTKTCPPDDPQHPQPCGGGYGTIQVTVTYQFQPLTLFFAPLTMTGKSTMYLE
jgi:Flp pilus assembly protein TadG